VAQTARNDTGSPWSVDRSTAVLTRAARRLPTRPAAGQPARRQRYRPRQTTKTPKDDDDGRQRAKQYWPISRPVKNNWLSWGSASHSTQNRLFRRRSSQPISWLGNKETIPNKTKASNTSKTDKPARRAASQQTAKFWNSHVTITMPLLLVICHSVARINIAYLRTKLDDFRFSRSSDMIGAPKFCNGSHDLRTPLSVCHR